ncbi:hypothetical protein [Candidatus Hodgkinia cicadicola]|uniref:hypothetical protein n=1 Tax=Candidatus Hodgkinia cicadicola TaxID=573658 RepID=UPI001788C5B6
MLLPINVKLLHGRIKTSDVIFIEDRVILDIVEIETSSKGEPKFKPITNDRFDPMKL